MSVQDREIYGCANFMIEKHGKDAVFHAAQKADELLAAGDLDGQRAWLRIIKAIEVLEGEGAGEMRH